MTLLAALAAGAAILSWWPSAGLVVAARLRTPSSRRRVSVVVIALCGAPVIGAVVVSLRPAQVLLTLAGSALVIGATRRWRLGRHSAHVARREAEVTELVLVLAAALRAGLPAPMALGQAAREFPVLAAAAHAALIGGDVPATLIDLGRRSAGGEGLSRLAAAWQVADSTGAPLAEVLDRLSIAEREERDVRREVRAGVAPARATATLMALLPAFGLLLGTGLGGDPLALIVEETLVSGAVCAGAGLAALGVWWIDRIAEAAERGEA